MPGVWQLLEVIPDDLIEGGLEAVDGDRPWVTDTPAELSLSENKEGKCNLSPHIASIKGRPLPFGIHLEQEREQARVVPPKSLDAALSRPAAGPKREREGVAPSHPWRGFDYSEKSIAAREKRGELCRLRK